MALDLPTEHKISSLVEGMFPQLYQEEGQTFIQFLKSYYEWMEEEGNTLYHGRRIMEYTDIDDTLEAFLSHFQQKYLYGIPFQVIINKRYLLKHVLDVYRSKSSILCFKLLFRLIYNQDVEVYLPGVDMLRWSDGTWKEPKYIEVTTKDILPSMVGKTIYGVSSKTTAVVESFVKEPVNSSIISTLYLSNIQPKGGEFNIGEKIVLFDERDASNIGEIIIAAPTVLGSMDHIEILNAGTNFQVGDQLAIVHRDVSNNEVISSGINGKVRVDSLSRQQGILNYTIVDPGFGYTTGAKTLVYNDVLDTTGAGGDFDVGSIAYAQTVTYCTDLLVDNANLALNATSFGFPGDPSGNISSVIGDCLTYTSALFGTIGSLTSVRAGNNYTRSPTIFVRDTLLSVALPGNVTYSTASVNVTGNGTSFSTYFANDDTICLQSNSFLSSTRDYQIIKQVTNATHMVLYGKPTLSSTNTSQYRTAPTILPASFAPYETIMYAPDGSINGENANVFAYPGIGNTGVGNTRVVDSGKGYIEQEIVKLYLSDGLDNIIIENAGHGYSNNEKLIFSGGDPVRAATGYVTTYANGSIASIVEQDLGNGYQVVPSITVDTANGTGARFSTVLRPFNTQSEVTGRVIKKGIGKARGHWSTTRGFFNSDKYIQDSFFYQDFSYQLKVATILEKYKNILYDTFHIAGAELFGQFLLKSEVELSMTVGFSDEPTIS